MGLREKDEKVFDGKRLTLLAVCARDMEEKKRKEKKRK
jgi:hypothetical protein